MVHVSGFKNNQGWVRALSENVQYLGPVQRVPITTHYSFPRSCQGMTNGLKRDRLKCLKTSQPGEGMRRSSQAKSSRVRLVLDYPPSSLTWLRPGSAGVLVALQLQSSVLSEGSGETQSIQFLWPGRLASVVGGSAKLARDWPSPACSQSGLSRRERAPSLHPGRSTWRPLRAPQRALVEQGGNPTGNRTARPARRADKCTCPTRALQHLESSLNHPRD